MHSQMSGSVSNTKSQRSSCNSLLQHDDSDECESKPRGRTSAKLGYSGLTDSSHMRIVIGCYDARDSTSSTSVHRVSEIDDRTAVELLRGPRRSRASAAFARRDRVGIVQLSPLILAVVAIAIAIVVRSHSLRRHPSDEERRRVPLPTDLGFTTQGGIEDLSVTTARHLLPSRAPSAVEWRRVAT